jgi:hypothetical protein
MKIRKAMGIGVAFVGGALVVVTFPAPRPHALRS